MNDFNFLLSTVLPVPRKKSCGKIDEKEKRKKIEEIMNTVDDLKESLYILRCDTIGILLLKNVFILQRYLLTCL